MGSPLTQVVKGYTALASLLLDRWSAQAAAVAAKVDAGTYDADSAAADLAATARLAAESGFLIVSEALDAVAVLGGRQDEPFEVDSDVFSTTVAGASLELTGPLVSGFGSELRASVVSVEPPQLAAGATDFRLRANATGCAGGTYVGAVRASAGGVAAETIDVWIIVP